MRTSPWVSRQPVQRSSPTAEARSALHAARPPSGTRRSNSPPAASASTRGVEILQVPAVEGLDQDLHPPAAALAEIGPERLIDDPRRPATGAQHLAGDVEHAEFELPAADGAVKGAVGPHDHTRAGLAGRGALHVMHGDEGGGAVPRHEIGELAPDPHPIGLPRSASQARRIASGVAGASSGTGFVRIERVDRVGERAEHAVRQHQRRLAHRLGAVDRLLAVGVGIERDAEIRRHVGGDRDLVGGGRVREQAALLASKTSSSVVSQPMPCTKPPSIWPMSMAGLSERPTSWRMSTRSTRFSPVSVSTITSEQAAP